MRESTSPGRTSRPVSRVPSGHEGSGACSPGAPALYGTERIRFSCIGRMNGETSATTGTSGLAPRAFASCTGRRGERPERIYLGIHWASTRRRNQTGRRCEIVFDPLRAAASLTVLARVGGARRAASRLQRRWRQRRARRVRKWADLGSSLTSLTMRGGYRREIQFVSNSHHSCPWRAERWNAWWLLCQPSPQARSPTHQQFVEPSGVL